MVVKTVGLHQVYDVKPVRLTCLCVADSEIVPLGIPPGVVVGLQDDIIFKFVHLDCSSKVSSFEPAFKNECVVIRTIRYVKLVYLPFYRL